MRYTRLLILTLALAAVALAKAPVRVKPHTTKRGTHVTGHRRTAGNKTQHDNWETKGNSNPDTGKRGTKTPRK
jgi:hypothetical protein